MDLPIELRPILCFVMKINYPDSGWSDEEKKKEEIFFINIPKGH